MPHMLTTPLCRKASVILVVISVVCVFATTVYAQGNAEALGGNGKTTSPTAQQSQPRMAPFPVARTDSPRETLGTFLRFTRELEEGLLAYQETQSRADIDQIRRLSSQFRQLLDLSEVPKASRFEEGFDILSFLLDIFGRLDLPPLESVPDADAYDDEKTPTK